MWQGEPSSSVQYVTQEDGKRVGVVMSLDHYQRLQTRYVPDPDELSGFTQAELEALAQGMLTSSKQERLQNLLNLNSEAKLNADEERELDQLIERIDLLNILKARAIFTLQQMQKMQIIEM